MKKVHFLLTASACGMLFLGACQGLSQDSVRAFIPGTFARSINTGMAKGGDSLIITALDESAGTFIIEHRSGYRQELDGKLLPYVGKVEKWTAIYDKEHHQLQVQAKEKVFTFVPEKGVAISNGGTEFKKVR